MSRKLTDEELIEDLKRVGNLLGKPPTSYEYEKYGKYSTYPYKSRRRWKEWLLICFNNNQTSFTCQIVCKNINELTDDLKRVFDIINKVPSKRDYTKYGKYSLLSYTNIKTWTEWCKEIFPNYSKTNSMRVPDDELVNDLKRVSKIVGKAPSKNEYEQYGQYTTATFNKRKDWSKWIYEVFGINPSAPKKISDEDLIKNLKYIYKKLGRVPKKEDLRLAKGSKFGASAYQRAFGTISNALKSAKIYHPKVNNEIMLKDIKNVYKKLGYTPRLMDYYEHTNFGYDCPSVYQFFTSWTKALIEAGVPVVKARNVSKQDVIDALQKRYEEHNQDPSCLTYWSIRKSKNFPYSCNTIKNKFDYIEWEEIMKFIDNSYQTKDPFIGRQQHIGNDGNTYLSAIEKQTADILYDLKNKNKIQSYEYEVKVCEDKFWTCDFVINGNIWLEVDGMRNNRKDPYNKENEKIQYYQANNFNYKILSYCVAIEEFINNIIKESK